MKFVVFIAVCMMACSTSTPPRSTAKHCTANVQCQSDEVCLTYSESTDTTSTQRWRDGICSGVRN